ncbi:MAG: cupin domain-containing protein [Terracidiphilus sp.]|jgi:quercetin dioxygenase-like cupin family protein
MKALDVHAYTSRIFFGAMLGSMIFPVPVASSLAKHPFSERVRTIFTHALPPLDGNHLKAAVIQVHYGPGESSPRHGHPCPVIGYVVQGAYRSQTEGEPERVYKSGDTFYEAPNVPHVLSANASKTEPATFLAVFVCDHDSPLSSDISASADRKGRSQ